MIKITLEKPKEPPGLRPELILFLVLAATILLIFILALFFSHPAQPEPAPRPTLTPSPPLPTSFIVLPTIPITPTRVQLLPTPTRIQLLPTPTDLPSNFGQYTTQKDDTLASIAEAVYGNRQAWTLIKSLNPNLLKTAESDDPLNPGNKIILEKTTKNLALGKPISQERGQVVYKDYAQKYHSQNITDGDDSTYWRQNTDSSGSLRAQIVIDLEKIQKINKLSYHLNWDRKARFDNEVEIKVSYSEKTAPQIDQLTDWTTLDIQSLTNEEMGKFVILDFSPISTRFVKIEYLNEDSLWAGWGNLYEVRVFNSEAS
jgi:hypothetical protein